MGDEDLLPLSGLQHLLFCERQCALIHVEGIWAENRLTTEGSVLHANADRAGSTERSSVKSVRGLVLRSSDLGLIGRADVVEFRAAKWGLVPFPVEYKRGRRRRWLHDEVQLCAQALCLEEMLGLAVPAGAIFYGASKRRRDVAFDPSLRASTIASVERFRALVAGSITPRAAPEPKCRSCSLRASCMPEVTCVPGRASRYLAEIIGGSG